MANISILIQNVLETNQYALIILDFILLAQYVLYNKNILYYMKNALYKLETKKLVFEQQ